MERFIFIRKKLILKQLDASNKLKSGEVLLIENIRFFKEEENDEETFAKKLQNLVIFI